jgi:hypothetical protein
MLRSERDPCSRMTLVIWKNLFMEHEIRSSRFGLIGVWFSGGLPHRSRLSVAGLCGTW